MEAGTVIGGVHRSCSASGFALICLRHLHVARAKARGAFSRPDGSRGAAFTTSADIFRLT